MLGPHADSNGPLVFISLLAKRIFQALFSVVPADIFLIFLSEKYNVEYALLNYV